MIPFASQRAEGQDLATHLSNAEDNEYVELFDIRGAVAGDLHGAFAEWETQAAAMTKCQNYLYSLSINPNPAQGPLPRELYEDYIARVETALKLDGQGRAVVFHIKEDKDGIGREHCHVVWSRIDVQECKAIHMAFDHDKLMTVTRQFARDHGIELAPGYHRLEDRKRQTYRQLSLYEKFQEDTTGLSREERQAIITDLWKQRDDPQSFITALEYHGYILATGKRPYVVVDLYGGVNSLPKMIADKDVRTKEVREFLGPAYDPKTPNHLLPTVQQAKEAAAETRKHLRDYQQSQEQADRKDQLTHMQKKRRETLEKQIALAIEHQKRTFGETFNKQLAQRIALSTDYVADSRALRAQREENRPRGLAGFLARVSGIEMIRRQIHKYEDGKRHAAFLDERQTLREQQRAERLELEHRQRMKMLDLERKRFANEQTEKRELQSLERSLLKQRRTKARRGHEHMPAMHLGLKPPGRPAMPQKAMNRFTSPFAIEQGKERMNRDEAEASVQRIAKLRGELPSGQSDLRADFQKAAAEPQRESYSGSGKSPDTQDRNNSQNPERDKGRRR